jgi:hypothetical protein
MTPPDDKNAALADKLAATLTIRKNQGMVWQNSDWVTPSHRLTDDEVEAVIAALRSAPIERAARIERVAEVLRNRFPFLNADDDMKDLARVIVALSSEAAPSERANEEFFNELADAELDPDLVEADLTAMSERANATRGEIVEALEPFAAEAKFYDPDEQDGKVIPDDWQIWGDCELTAGQLRRARTVFRALASSAAPSEGEWRPIESYPFEMVPRNDPDGDPWGPEVLVLTDWTKNQITIDGVKHPEFNVAPVRIVAHLEAGMWLSRCGNDSISWDELEKPPTHWMPIADAPPRIDRNAAEDETA